MIHSQYMMTSVIRPQNYKELFNYRHTWLQNVIEHIFGVVKRRSKVLVIAQEYSLETQSQLISALAVLHNIICVYDPSDVLDDPNEEIPQYDTPSIANWAIGPEEWVRAAKRRDKIAQDMWNEYEHWPGRRRCWSDGVQYCMYVTICCIKSRVCPNIEVCVLTRHVHQRVVSLSNPSSR